MRSRYHQIAFTPSVAAAQEHYGSREVYARRGERGAGEEPATLTEQERLFLAHQDGFFLATVSETGWPYVQFRGGPKGFLRVVGDRTLAWADYRGNRQYISVGNASADDWAAIIVLDHARQARIKLFGHLRVEDVADADPALAEAVAIPGYPAKVERIVRFEVEAYDWNCPQHITPRFTAAEIAEAVAPLKRRIAELEERLAAAGASPEAARGH